MELIKTFPIENDCKKTEKTPLEKISEALFLLGKGKKTVRDMRALIVGLEAVMWQIPGHTPGCDFETTHHFHDFTYMRELFIPAGFVVIGKIHNYGHLNVLTKGKITVWTEEGMKTLTAPQVIKSGRGLKRVGYAHEDCIWMTVHHNPTDEREVSKVEKLLFSETFDEAYLSSKRNFDDAICFLGFTPEEVKEISENESDCIPFITGQTNVEIKESSVHGKGVFANKDFSIGDIVTVARVNGKRTPSGRFTNHSGVPNVKASMSKNGDLNFVAVKEIKKGDEIFNDYYFDFERSRYKEGLKCL